MYDNYEEAKCHETVGHGNYKKLIGVFDTAEPFPSYSRDAARFLSLNETELLDRWRSVRDSFDSVSEKMVVISRASKLFPPTQSDDFSFLYLMGKKDFLLRGKVTVLGRPSPSMQAKKDTLSFVSEMERNGVAVLSPIDAGIPAFALNATVKTGGFAIGVASSPIGKADRENLIPLYRNLYENALIVSPFSPASRNERWMVKIRNDFISAISALIFLAEEKDGGPSWAIADRAMNNDGARLMISAAALNVPEFTWMRKRYVDGAALFSSEKDARKFVKGLKNADCSPDLFS